MRVVLLALSGDEARARETLAGRYPQASIESIPRVEIERGSFRARLRALRARRPDIFAVSTERLAWQRGQNALLLFGALAGAERSVILDAHGAFREEQRARILASAPWRLAHEATQSAVTIIRAERELRRLEREVGSRSPGGAGDVKLGRAASDQTDIIYLRATPGAGTQVGGAASHVKGFINAAVERGARVTLISNDRIAGLDGASTPVKIIEPDASGVTRAAFDLHHSLLFTRRAVREIERAQPDFIYQRYGRFTWAGVEATLRTGRPLFLEYNGSEVWVGRYWDRSGMLGLLARCERLNLRAATRIFVVSEVERRNLLRAGVHVEKIVVNPNGVDVKTFRPGVGGARAREELGIKDDTMLAGFVGTFGPWHGALVLAEAITLLPEAARVTFLLVGSGAERDEAERIVNVGGVESRVIFTGAVAHERVPALLDACDVLVSPHVPLADGSEFFGSPTKLFEYMAMGKAIVASRLGQIADVLADGETALLVEPGDARALSEAIISLSESAELRQRLGAAARREAIERHTWEHNAERVLRAYAALHEDHV
ncbi:MAG TPA: glycosyltransferase family 4 protein [Pyrinomonadaceae bacterium]|jgi:glycosyltransferase involved in cell wall biosynthesis